MMLTNWCIFAFIFVYGILLLCCFYLGRYVELRRERKASDIVKHGTRSKLNPLRYVLGKHYAKYVTLEEVFR